MRKDLLAESRKQSATKLLRQVPSIGPIRAALLTYGVKDDGQIGRTFVGEEIKMLETENRGSPGS